MHIFGKNALTPWQVDSIFTYEVLFLEQIFDLDNQSLEEVARHMGHELTTHRHYYRMQDDVIELAKVSKLLLALESGKAHQYRNMSLDDIDLEGIFLLESTLFHLNSNRSYALVSN